jgi:3-isopropylmalate/(R)-2-methylmalate dehydratase small subunit
MRPVSVVRGRMAPLFRPDIDTDQIIPKQFLKRIERTGFGPFLFYNWAHKEDGDLDDSFVLNRDEYRNAKVLVAGANFGCGSSREHAVWALQDRGFEAVIAPSFADIFYNNSSKVGLLCVTLAEDIVAELAAKAEQDPSAEVAIDLKSQTVACDDLRCKFDIDPFIRERLLNGWDDIALTERFMEEIAKFESGRSGYYPAVHPGSARESGLDLKPAKPGGR